MEGGQSGPQVSFSLTGRHLCVFACVICNGKTLSTCLFLLTAVKGKFCWGAGRGGEGY